MKGCMAQPTTEDNASTPKTPDQEISEIEQAQASEAGEVKQPDKTESELSAFDKLAQEKGFKSADALAESYKQLENKLAPQSREIKELKRMVSKIQESTAPKEADPLEDLPEEQKQALDLLAKVIDRRLDDRLSPLVKQAEVDQAKTKIQAVKETYPEITDGEIEHALDIMSDYPKMDLEEAVKISSFDRTYGRLKTVKDKTASTSKNKKAFAESASDARQGDEMDYSKMTLEELEKIIPR